MAKTKRKTKSAPKQDVRKLVPTKTEPDARGKFPLLLSYAYLRKMPEEQQEWIFSNPHVEFLIDSGGFTALNAGEEIPLGDYISWLHRWKDRLFGYVALDKLGDPKASDDQLQVMLKEGLQPVPVHVRGDDEKRMDQLFEWSDWVALGGFRRPHKGWGSPEYVKQKMHWAKGRNVHWLGYTRSDMVLGFRPYSCDSSNQAAGRVWGHCHIYRGLGKMQTGKYYEWRERPFDMELAQRLDRAGFTRNDFANKKLWRKADVALTRFLPNEVTISSWVDYARDMRAQVGTRYFQATTPVFTGRLFYWIDRTLPPGEEPYLKDGVHPEWAK